MALVQCKECGSAVSAKARSCPHCGVPRSSRLKGCFVRTVGIVGAIFGALIGLNIVNEHMGGFGPTPATTEGARGPVEIDTSTFRGGSYEDYIIELEQRCVIATYQTPPDSNRKEFLDQCIEGGKTQLRLAGLIE